MVTIHTKNINTVKKSGAVRAARAGAFVVVTACGGGFRRCTGANTGVPSIVPEGRTVCDATCRWISHY